MGTASARAATTAATIGETLRAVATGWDPEATLTYQWKRYGQRIDGATSACTGRYAPTGFSIL